MRHIAAYLLATISDDSAVPTESKIQNILGSVGVEADDKQLKIVIKKFAGKSPASLITEGHKLLASMPTAGSAGIVAAPVEGAPKEKEEKKEEKKEESEEESDEDMGFGLFD